MGQTIQQTINLETETCAGCGIGFAMPAWLMKRARETGELFYCPRGCSMSYTKSEVQRLREKLDAQTKTATLMAARAHAAEMAEQKAQTEIRRMKKRASAGVCPCCNRTFQQLARHMKTKHPDMALRS